MRRLLRCKAVTIIAAVVSFTAIPAAGIVVTATPALASGDICLAFGHGCVGSGDIDIGSLVVLTSTGRVIDEVARNYTCCGGYEVYQLQFNSDTARCIGVESGTLFVTVRDCSGGNAAGVNWAREPQPNGTVYWWNNPNEGALESNNVLGYGLELSACIDQPNCYLAWNG